jgi:hypothetical protein
MCVPAASFLPFLGMFWQSVPGFFAAGLFLRCSGPITNAASLAWENTSAGTIR